MSDGRPQSPPELDRVLSHPHTLCDIIIVAVPIVVLGVIGNMIGLSILGDCFIVLSSSPA